MNSIYCRANHEKAISSREIYLKIINYLCFQVCLAKKEKMKGPDYRPPDSIVASQRIEFSEQVNSLVQLGYFTFSVLQI